MAREAASSLIRPLGVPLHRQAQSDRERFPLLLLSLRPRDTTPPAASRHRHLRRLMMAGVTGIKSLPPAARPHCARSRPTWIADPPARGAPARRAPASCLTSLGQFLLERARPPHVQRLQPVTNAEDRLAHVVGILRQQLVGVVAKASAGAVSGCRCAPYFSGSTSAGLPGQQHAIAALNRLCDLRVGGLRFDDDRLASGRAHRATHIAAARANVVWPRRVGNRNSDARFHVDSICGISGFGVSSGLGFVSPVVSGKARPSSANSTSPRLPVVLHRKFVHVAHAQSVRRIGSPMINSTPPGNRWKLFMGRAPSVPTIAIGIIGACALSQLGRAAHEFLKLAGERTPAFRKHHQRRAMAQGLAGALRLRTEARASPETMGFAPSVSNASHEWVAE